MNEHEKPEDPTYATPRVPLSPTKGILGVVWDCCREWGIIVPPPCTHGNPCH